MVRPYWAENPDVKPKVPVESEAEPPLSLLSISKYCNSLRSADPYSDTHSASAEERHVRSLSRRGGALFHPVKLGKKLTLGDILQIPDDFREFSDNLMVSGIEPSLPETGFNYLGVVTKPPPLVASTSWDELNATRQCLSATFHSPQQTAVERTPDPLIQKRTTAEMLSNIVLPSSPSFDELITDTVMSTLLATADREATAIASKKRSRNERGMICDRKHEKGSTDEEVERDRKTRDTSVTEDTGAARTLARKEKRRGKVFQAYQESQWNEKFSEMCEYQHKFGHCIVPYTYAENPTLVRWVKRQRYQYKLRAQGMKNSTMTLDRITTLENIGFVWDSQGASWMERWQELKAFKAAFGHCNVPSNYRNNKCLATWIKGQRKSDLWLLLLKLRTRDFLRFVLDSLFLPFR
jgi:Helicase associated domain